MRMSLKMLFEFGCIQRRSCGDFWSLISLGIGIFIGVIDKLKRVKRQFESAMPLVQLYQ